MSISGARATRTRRRMLALASALVACYPVCARRWSSAAGGGNADVRRNTMTRRDWLMLFISFEGAPRGLDPVRLQKGMFLFGEEVADVPDTQKYSFRPYNYGPMSSAIYADLDRLVADGLIESVPVEGQSWSRFRPTERGVQRGMQLLEAATADQRRGVQHLYETKRSVARMSFDALLEDVYERYPQYATKSVFKRRA
ncbi:MAG: hypothetical protein QOG94_249 [Solirubrobacteraceae bacterium]|nr:hypothetical protein [Solirubrobacteraceae bacterium]